MIDDAVTVDKRVIKQREPAKHGGDEQPISVAFPPVFGLTKQRQQRNAQQQRSKRDDAVHGRGDSRGMTFRTALSVFDGMCRWNADVHGRKLRANELPSGVHHANSCDCGNHHLAGRVVLVAGQGIDLHGNSLWWDDLCGGNGVYGGIDLESAGGGNARFHAPFPLPIKSEGSQGI